MEISNAGVFEVYVFQVDVREHSLRVQQALSCAEFAGCTQPTYEPTFYISIVTAQTPKLETVIPHFSLVKYAPVISARNSVCSLHTTLSCLSETQNTLKE